MTDIITLTSPHLNGIIFQVLKDEKQSAVVLKAVFTKIWKMRRFGHLSADPLNAMRAIAHRYALTYKHLGQSALEGDTLAEMSAKGSATLGASTALSKADTEMLRQVYQNSPSNIGGTEAEHPLNAKVSEKIKDIVSKMARDI